MTRNRRFDETEDLLTSVCSALPDGWQAQITGNFDDAKLQITSRTGASAAFTVLGAGFSSSRMPWVVRWAETTTGPKLIWQQYLSAPVRKQLARAGINYADATGWERIVSDEPMQAITGQGATKAPKSDRASTSISRLSGRAAGRIIRALFDVARPIGVRELAAYAQVSPGTVSKTLPTLAADNTIERDADGRVESVDRRHLLDRWTADYQVLKANGTPAWFLAPRGIDSALTGLIGTPRVAVSGAKASQAWLPQGIAPLVPTTQLLVYTDQPSALARSLALAEVEPSTANVVILIPQDPAILDNPESRDGVPVAPLPLVLADLLTLPGRYPQLAEALMDALAKTDPQWRP